MPDWLGWLADLLMAVGGIITGCFISKEAPAFTGIQTMVAILILAALVGSIVYGQLLAGLVRTAFRPHRWH